MKLIEMAEEAGLNPKCVSGTGGGEFHSSCPSCGGTDRFIIQPYRKVKNCTGSYWCRQCGIKGDAIQFGRDFLKLDFHSAVERAQATLPEKQPLGKILAFPHLNGDKISSYEMLKAPSSTWTTKALSIVESAHQQILLQAEILQWLEARGLPIAAVNQYKLGWIEQDTFHPGGDWGLEKDKVWLPKGIVIPTWQKNIVVRIKIRQHDYKKHDTLSKYVVVSGSMNGLNVIGNTEKAVMVVVESELDAYALHYIFHDVAVIVAVGSSMKNPDNVTNALAHKKKILLICRDNDDPGKKMFDKWKNLYPHAKDYPTPIGKDVGEAIQQGLDLNAWLQSILQGKEDSVAAAADKPQTVDAVVPILGDTNPSNQPTSTWHIDNQVLIDWFLNAEKNGQLSMDPFVLSTKYGDESVTDPAGYYICLRAAIADGPTNSQVITGWLQEILRALQSRY